MFFRSKKRGDPRDRSGFENICTAVYLEAVFSYVVGDGPRMSRGDFMRAAFDSPRLFLALLVAVWAADVARMLKRWARQLRA